MLLLLHAAANVLLAARSTDDKAGLVGLCARVSILHGAFLVCLREILGAACARILLLLHYQGGVANGEQREHDEELHCGGHACKGGSKS